jgi:hypothetical protein
MSIRGHMLMGRGAMLRVCGYSLASRRRVDTVKVYSGTSCHRHSSGTVALYGPFFLFFFVGYVFVPMILHVGLSYH